MPGEVLPVLVRHVTQPMIDAYAEASGDFNPIHVDPEFAKTGPFGRTIAHGLMTLAFVAQMLNEHSSGAFDESGEIDIAFVGPVYAGDTVEVSGEIEDVVSARALALCAYQDPLQAGERQILVGTAIQPIGKTGGRGRGA